MKYNIALPFLIVAGVATQYAVAEFALPSAVITETSVTALKQSVPATTGVTIPFLPPEDIVIGGEGTTSKRDLMAENAAAKEGTAMIILHQAVKEQQKKKKKVSVWGRKAVVPMPIIMGMHVAASQEIPPEKGEQYDESETPRPTTTFCRKIGNPKSPAARKEICFERDDILRKVVRTYEKKK